MILASVPGHPSSLHLQTPRNTIFLAQKKDQEVDPADVENMGKKTLEVLGFFPYFLSYFFRFLNLTSTITIEFVKFQVQSFHQSWLSFAPAAVDATTATTAPLWDAIKKWRPRSMVMPRILWRKTCPQKRALFFGKKKATYLFFGLWKYQSPENSKPAKQLWKNGCLC